MTTGATGQLGLALPVQGELSGTWGDTVNNGITQYTNIAIAGTLTLTGDGAVTLANTTGDASASNITSTLTGAGTVTAQFAIVKVTGTLTVAKVVTGPSYSKTYTVVNAATGGIVTFKASGQTGVSIAVGETAFVYFNGTDYVKIVGTATAGAAGGSTTQVQFNSSGILSGSSSLTWDGTTLSSTQVNITGQGTLRLQDTTGGEYVALRAPASLAGNYTLTFPADDGTSGQALITDGSGVLSWSTAASGDVYGPGSSTDNAVARFDSTTGKLLQNSVVLIGDTGAVTGVTDLTASGSVTLSGGTANGVAYLNGSKVVTSGSALVFDGTKLLVGSNTAGYGTLNVARDTTTPYASLTITDEANAANTVGLYLRQSGSSPAGISTAGAPIAFYTGGAGTTEGMRLTSTGLGIGTSSPSTKLHVNTGSAGYGITVAASSQTGATYQIGIDSNSALAIYDSAATAQRLVLSNSGNLGLGVTPSAWGGYGAPIIQLPNTGTIVSNDQFAYFGANWYYATSALRYITSSEAASYYGQTGGAHKWFSAPSGTAGDAITFTQAMTLDASGNLLVGTTSLTSNERVSIVTGATEGFRVKTTGGASASAGIIHNATTTGDNVFIDFGTEASYTSRGSITYNRAGGLVAYNVTSDYRAKDITGSVTNSGALIDSVPVYMGKMKDATQERPMFIAHETPAYAHTGVKDAVDADGNPVYQQMDASALIPVMWAEIQSLRKRLADAGI